MVILMVLENNERAAKIEALLGKKYKLIYYDSVDSTNNIAKNLSREAAQEGTVILAEKQTSGRGRMGRSFLSEKGGIYLSVLLRPKLSVKTSVRITTAAAVAAAEVIEELSGKKAQIKWVNDVYIDNLKVAGILTEGVINPENQMFNYAVLGIGVNLVKPEGDFPKELKDIAGAVFDDADDEIYAKAVSGIIKRFFYYYKKIEDNEYIINYRRRLMLTGKEVSYEKDGETHKAKVLGIDDEARLILEENGETVKLSAGEVSVKLC